MFRREVDVYVLAATVANLSEQLQTVLKRLNKAEASVRTQSASQSSVTQPETAVASAIVDFTTPTDDHGSGSTS